MSKQSSCVLVVFACALVLSCASAAPPFRHTHAPDQPGMSCWKTANAAQGRNRAQTNCNCPVLPTDCANRIWDDQTDWTKKPPADCPKPPDGGCWQAVLGRAHDLASYAGCPGYVVLNLSDYSTEKNNDFIACSVAGQPGRLNKTLSPIPALCDVPIRIVSGQRSIDGSRNWTQTELCQLDSCGCDVKINFDEPGLATCPMRKGATGTNTEVKHPQSSPRPDSWLPLLSWQQHTGLRPQAYAATPLQTTD
jgi:hypothetical protein